MYEERDFTHRPSKKKVEIPAGLLTYRVWGEKVKSYNSSFKPSNLNRKISEWKEDGLKFVEIKQNTLA